MDKEEFLEEFFEDKRLWKGKYKVEWCDLCGTATIVCPEKSCSATACNGTSCGQCHDDTDDFIKNVKSCIEDYLTEEEILIAIKIKRLKHLILESIRMGDKEIDWDKMRQEGKLCDFDIETFNVGEPSNEETN